MSELELKLGKTEALLLWAIFSEQEQKIFDELNRRRLLRKDGELNQSKKYTSQYEEGLLEDYNHLMRLKAKVDKYVDALL